VARNIKDFGREPVKKIEMTYTLEQLKAILDNGGTITNGKDEISRPDFRDEIYQVKGFNDNLFWWHNAARFIGDPKDWKEVKKEAGPNEPKVLTMDLNGTKYVCVPVEVYKIEREQWHALMKEVGALKELNDLTK
jgi:hypothetical protein